MHTLHLNPYHVLTHVPVKLQRKAGFVASSPCGVRAKVPSSWSKSDTVRPARTSPNRPVPVCQAGRGSSDPWWLKDNPPNMRDVNSIQELVDALADAGDRLVIVEFYAQWCNACRALFPKLCKIMGENPDVLFLKVNFDQNKDACRTLAVKVLPYFHLYRGAEGRVAAFSCTISKLQIFKDALESFSSPFCSLEPTPGLAEFPSVVAHPERADGPASNRDSWESDSEELHPLADTPTVIG